MRETISLSMFRDSFVRAGRKDQFSYTGLKALYDHLEEIQPDYNLDIIDLCCSYTEYASFEEALEDLSCSPRELEANHLILEFKNGIIINNN